VEVVKEEKPVLSFDEAKELKRKKNKLSNQVKRCEESIAELEEKISTLDKQIAGLDYTDETLSAKLLAEYKNLQATLDAKMAEWETSTQELEQIMDEG
jgi:hypothetical protein